MDERKKGKGREGEMDRFLHSCRSIDSLDIYQILMDG
jgi:hypothetical protein